MVFRESKKEKEVKRSLQSMKRRGTGNGGDSLSTVDSVPWIEAGTLSIRDSLTNSKRNFFFVLLYYYWTRAPLWQCLWFL